MWLVHIAGSESNPVLSFLCFYFQFEYIHLYTNVQCFKNKEHAFMINYNVNISRINSSIKFIIRLSYIEYSIKTCYNVHKCEQLYINRR